MLTPNQPVQTFNVAETLKNEEGRFLVQRAGQSALVSAKSGHSIVSWKPVGTLEPTAISPGSNPPYTVTRIDEISAMETH
jgi:hypothetical protein